MAKVSKKQDSQQLEFYKKLVLNQYFMNLFNKDNFDDLAKDFKRIDEEYDDSNNTYFYHHLKLYYCNGGSLNQDKIKEYDENIVRFTKHISAKREKSLSGGIIKWKYYQYLSLLFTEIYLDRYFSDKKSFLNDLNTFVKIFNDGVQKKDRLGEFELDSLNKLAFWNATGSGKTLIMHMNILQYQHYYEKHNKHLPFNKVILLTPNEGLSRQHEEELMLSNIPAEIFVKSGLLEENGSKIVKILDIHKFQDDEKKTVKGKDKTIAVQAFEGNNLVLVDEGHKGTGGEDWMNKRNILCANGFSFEYSATFGQAMKKTKTEIVQQYAKCILFDYSYKYFHGDGYGKDYNILNLEKDFEEEKRDIYLTASILVFYQQMRLFNDIKKELIPFNIEKPLTVFVGSTVTGGNLTSNGVTDVVTVLKFLADFVGNKTKAVDSIKKIIENNAGLLDKKNREIFARNLPYVNARAANGITANDIYNDMLRLIFNTTVPGAKLHIDNLKGAEGEIGLRVGDGEYFAVINVGADSKLVDMCSAAGLLTDEIAFTGSMFDKITTPDSPINILIGSKKFIEGWNCLRVSNMGLIHFGSSEGATVIQLFGRGVRLKGYNGCLKRSDKLDKSKPSNVPKYLHLLETLNVFGVKADYMATFQEYLRNEGLSKKDIPFEITLPVIRSFDEKTRTKLKLLKLPQGTSFIKQAKRVILTLPNEDMKRKLSVHPIEVDEYTKLQSLSSRQDGYEIPKDKNRFSLEHLAFIDFDKVFFEITRFKNEKVMYNMSISKSVLKRIMGYAVNEFAWYTIFIPDAEMVFDKYENFFRWQELTITLLKKYCLFYFDHCQREWEEPKLVYDTLNEDDPNYVEEYTVKVYGEENENIVKEIEKLSKILVEAHGDLSEFAGYKAGGGFKAFKFDQHLYNPLVCIEKSGLKIEVSPVALDKNEAKFVEDLREYYKNNKAVFETRELYLLRNKSKAGIGFFIADGFHPDFIMWIVVGNKQYITFVDPKGLLLVTGGIENSKVKFGKTIKEIQAEVAATTGECNVVLNSYILSGTSHEPLTNHWKVSKAEIEKQNVLFMEDDDYIERLINSVLISD